jgi:hypothetical protein
MPKPLYNAQSISSVEQNVKHAKRSLLLIGLLFITFGVWALLTELPLGRSTGRIVNLFLAFINPENRATVIYSCAIAFGVFLILISCMKSYKAAEKKDYKSMP